MTSTERQNICIGLFSLKSSYFFVKKLTSGKPDFERSGAYVYLSLSSSWI